VFKETVKGGDQQKNKKATVRSETRWQIGKMSRRGDDVGMGEGKSNANRLNVDELVRKQANGDGQVKKKSGTANEFYSGWEVRPQPGRPQNSKGEKLARRRARNWMHPHSSPSRELPRRKRNV